jgi:tripartite-type tricarboxylate transporter receptor subunit TctC
MKRILVCEDFAKKGIKLLGIVFLTVILVISMQQIGIAQDFPIKPVTLVVPHSPGGPVDVDTRSIAEIAKEFLGQPIVVTNKPGGGGIISATFVAKEKPDGYNLAIIPLVTFVTIPQMRDVSYDVFNDFEFIIGHSSIGGGIFCRAEKPWKSMRDLVAYSKQHPGSVSCGHLGVGGSNHLAVEFIFRKEGIKWRLVPYDGASKAVPALLGGHVDVLSSGEMLPRGHVRSGELRALAIDGLAKEYFPGAATFEELGYELAVGGSFGIAAPKGTSADIVKKLHDSFKKAIEDPRYEATCKKTGVFKAYMSGEDLFKRLRKEYELRGEILKELGLAKTK